MKVWRRLATKFHQDDIKDRSSTRRRQDIIDYLHGVSTADAAAIIKEVRRACSDAAYSAAC